MMLYILDNNIIYHGDLADNIDMHTTNTDIFHRQLYHRQEDGRREDVAR